MNLAQKIKAARNNLGITQEKLSELSGISIQNIKKLETSPNSNPTNNTLKKLALALEVNEEYFVSKLSPSTYPKMSPNVSQSAKLSKNLSPSQTKLKETEKESFYYIPKLNISASAGGGNELEGLECYESGELMAIDKAFFKTIPSSSIKAIRVDGYSMTPMLFPDSWVVFEETHKYQGDGLYILNFDNQLMVKLLQLNPISKILDIISVNKDYKSYSIDLRDSQVKIIIQGKVLRSII
ncbi:LexA family transcriptional regulator [Campylobacter jejuni]|nr:LexA family transcriptional regulator [Campylobacter jejuni]ECL2361640.1 LexA family transcriptional regulator [Campylobacter jejuni]HED7248757.1 LexA family transcriptional regulator [Campylobacter jejuni]HEG6281665.1 LexA family transcriptional regulator [Campylobacter jejuni]